jgi:prepilin-type N-terminal cleavage/methylation domain-containing protein
MKQSSRSGFTVVEVLVTIIIMGVAIGSISSLFISARNVQVQTLRYDQATRAAAKQIESLRNNYSSLVSGTTINFTSSLPSSLPNATGTTAISAPAADLRRADVTITYVSYGKTRTVKLSSLIGQIGISQ